MSGQNSEETQLAEADTTGHTPIGSVLVSAGCWPSVLFGNKNVAVIVG